MSKSVEATGSCLCGAVTIAAKTMSLEVGVCHCNKCRKWAGGPVMGLDCQTDVDIQGEENISRFSSSEWGDRCFCSTCGTHLFFHYKPANSYFIPAGMLEREQELKMTSQIFTDEKPGYYAFKNETVNMTGAELMAQYSNEPL